MRVSRGLVVLLSVTFALTLFSLSLVSIAAKSSLAQAAPPREDRALDLFTDLAQRDGNDTEHDRQLESSNDGALFRTLGQLGGRVNVVKVEGARAYLGVGPRLFVIDVSAPDNPTLLGQTKPLANTILGIDISGEYAYVAIGTNGLCAVHIGNPSAPQAVDCVDTPGTARGISVLGNYAYVADFNEGLAVLDISSPTSPKLAKTVAISGYTWDVVALGTYAYVGATYDGLSVVDISNPPTAAEVSLMNSVVAFGVDISGEYVYAGGFMGGLHVINVSDVTSPTVEGTAAVTGLAVDVDVEGDYAYVANDYGLSVVDVSNKQNPDEIGVKYNNWERVESVAVSDGHAFLAITNRGLNVLDVSSPGEPTIAAVHLTEVPSVARDVEVVGDLAFVTAEKAGIRIVDVSDRSDPVEMGQLHPPNFVDPVTNLVVSGTYVYAGLRNSLWIIDVGLPSSPANEGFLFTDEGYYVNDVAVNGNHAIVAAEDGLYFVDVSVPMTPTRESKIPTTGSVPRVAISGTLAYAVDYTDGLFIVDIADPSSPSKLGSVALPGNDLSGVALYGNYAYVANGDAGLRIIDVSNPNSPFEAGSFDTGGYASGLTIADGKLYQLVRGESLLLDLTLPLSPTQVATFSTPGGGGNIQKVGDYLYVANGGSGLVVIWEGNLDNQVYLPLLMKN